ncbi:hypothetical protein [Chitinophaga sp.]|uniref:hypothetical protein n=1 Tax=Chitinophaga sp. TaxID=1869181 RepID=UPI0031D9D4DE
MNWQSFKSLHELYKNGRTKNRTTLAEDAVFRYHTYQTKELLFTKKDILTTANGNFRNTFENRYLDKYNECLELLIAIGEDTPQCRFELDDILRLREMKRQMDNGDLEDIRQQIKDSNETRRGVSLMFFKHEKHLDSSEALERAVRTILKIDSFSDSRDFQYLYILQCHNPKAIVLCENLYFLKMPERPRKNNIELWYAGGRNVEKLIYSQNRNLPIYYMCDWDYDGLDIFRLVKDKIPTIQLLTPNGEPKDIIKSEHKSLWKNPEAPTLLSGLSAHLYTESQKQLIEKLIRENTWIVEESNDLMLLLS